jgi:hypothetical protein
VVFGLQPEDRHHRLTGLRLQRLRQLDRRGGLVDGEERTEEQSDLLASDHRRGTGAQRGELRIARRARRQPRLLRREGVGDRRDERPRGARDGAAAIFRRQEVARIERRRVAGEIALEEAQDGFFQSAIDLPTCSLKKPS